MEAKKKMVSRRGGLTIFDTEARELQSKRAEDTVRNADNANAEIELSPNLALTADVESPVPMNSSMKRPRGRPRGSGKLQVLTRIGGEFAETAGGKLFHHFLEVPKGADIASVLKSFYESTSRAVFVKSAIGKVQNVTLRPPRPPNSDGYSICFEGISEIVSLTGRFKQNGENSPTPSVGTLTISVARANGEVVGGVVAGPLVAVTPIQVVLGVFEQGILKERKKYRRSNASRSNASNRNDHLQIVTVPDHDNPKTPDDSSEATVEEIPKTKDDNEISTAPAASADLGVGSKEADSSVMNIAAPRKVGELALQVWKPPTDEEVNYETPTTPILALDQADTVIIENQTTFHAAASPLSVSDYAMQDDAGNFDILMPQPLSIYAEADYTVLNDDQASIPASPHADSGLPMEAWSPPPDQTIAPDAGGASPPSSHEK